MRIDTVTAVVTGAAQGLGRCFTLELARAGARVMAGDIQADGLGTLAEEARGLAGRVETMALDVTQEASVRGFLGETAARLGTPNLLVNNAGILRDGVLALREEDGFVRKMPSVQWKSVIETNLTGCYVMAREVVSQMLENGVSPGLVVNISSITGAGNPGQGNYAAAKAGLDAATRTWALELAQYGIRVGGIAPGLIDTPMAQALDPDERAGMVADVPLGRMGRPEEIWAALRFIVECDFFTGRVIQVDGGASYS
ncbi:SDR family oxidoreductase (plasmid) [Skermanella mucosa]|uniref:SDR family NAD(P)-dependent oxidoreductase n=1 Tax=Skermanella mucosa TaxID=1789672 RepID=UPI00192B5125|nr:SDR family NAD(P)-dependent oxidoreductase [Skermanella mucosa]UEM24878.1 SDR family oxidoreductase [Skermanella mucosa]